MSPAGKAVRVATASTLRRATLTPDDVICLAAVEATNSEPGRQALALTEEIARNCRMHAQLVGLCLHGLSRQRLLDHPDDGWVLTRLGREVLAELIRAQRKGRPRFQ